MSSSQDKQPSANSKRRGRSKSSKLLALALGFGFLFGLLWIGERYAVSQGFASHVVFDYDTTPRDLIYRHMPDQHFMNPDPVWIDINDVGLRDPREIVVPKPEGVFRVLCLGDSYTYGLAIAHEDTYAQQLEKLLRERAGNDRIEVWNAGTNGYTSCQELAYLEHYGFALEPDLVTVGFVMNDVIPILAEDIPKPIKGRQILMRSALFRMGQKWLRKARGPKQNQSESKQWLREYQGEVELSPTSSEQAKEMWGSAADCLEQLATRAGERSIPVVLMVFPIWNQMHQPVPEPGPQGYLRELCARTELSHLDLLKVYAKAGKPALLKRDNAHPSVLGHKIASAKLFEHIIAEGFFPKTQ